LLVERATGIEPGTHAALRQVTAVADLAVAEAGERLVLDWTSPNRYATFYRPRSGPPFCGRTGEPRPLGREARLRRDHQAPQDLQRVQEVV